MQWDPAQYSHYADERGRRHIRHEHIRIHGVVDAPAVLSALHVEVVPRTALQQVRRILKDCDGRDRALPEKCCRFSHEVRRPRVVPTLTGRRGDRSSR